MNSRILGGILAVFLMLTGGIKEGLCADLTPPFEEQQSTPPKKQPASSEATDYWTIAPFVSYYTFTGAGDSRFFNNALGIGGEIEHPLPGKHSVWRWDIDGSYIQMTPGPTLFATSTQSNLFASPSQAPLSGPLPGSASITGWMMRTGIAREFPAALPDGWLGHGVVVPYVRLDVGAVDFSASGAGALNGHPMGFSLDGGVGISLRVPSFPMGVFAEITPTFILISQEELFMTPLTTGITFHF